MKKALQEFISRCPGVLGCIVVDDKEKVVEKELPSFLEVDLSQLVGQIGDIYLALEDIQKRNIRKNRDYDFILNYDSIKVYVRSMQNGILILVAEYDANPVKLKSLSNLLMKKLQSIIKNTTGE